MDALETCNPTSRCKLQRPFALLQFTDHTMLNSPCASLYMDWVRWSSEASPYHKNSFQVVHTHRGKMPFLIYVRCPRGVPPSYVQFDVLLVQNQVAKATSGPRHTFYFGWRWRVRGWHWARRAEALRWRWRVRGWHWARRAEALRWRWCPHARAGLQVLYAWRFFPSNGCAHTVVVWRSSVGTVVLAPIDFVAFQKGTEK